MEKRTIAVIFGGCSPEYPVSLESSHSVVVNFDREKYDLILLGITKGGEWFRYYGGPEGIENDTWREGVCVPAVISPDRETHGIIEFGSDGVKATRIDAAFPVMHGKNGEDGTIQGLCEMAGIPIIGCGALASAICMDKDRAHRLASLAGVDVPKATVFTSMPDEAELARRAGEIGFPVFVKPVRAGSSFGITKVSDAAALIVYAPQSDISEDEADILSGYVNNGGKLLVMAGPVQDAELTNLYSILAPYGVTPAEGVVIEGDRAHYAFSTPALLMPDMAESGVTQALIDEGYYIILPIAAGLELGDNASSAAVTSLLTTSDAAYSKAAGYDMTTYDKEEGDTDGPFSLGVQIEYEDGGIVWISSGTFLEDMYNAYSSGANVNLAMNALSSLIGESETMSIRAKSLNYNYLTISDSTAGLLKFVMIGLIPLAFLAAGITVVVRRRRLLK